MLGGYGFIKEAILGIFWVVLEFEDRRVGDDREIISFMFLFSVRKLFWNYR